MSELAERIVTEAMSWVGTRYVPQGRIKHKAVDCVGFVAGVATACELQVDIPSNYQPVEDGKLMMKLLKDHLDFVANEDIKRGDVLAMCDTALRDTNKPTHLVFVESIVDRGNDSKTTFIVHASEHGVRRHRMNSWLWKQVHSAWRIRK